MSMYFINKLSKLIYFEPSYLGFVLERSLVKLYLFNLPLEY